MIKVYTDKEFQHYMEVTPHVSGVGRRMVEQLYEENKRLSLAYDMTEDDKKCMREIIESGDSSRAALVKSHRELEESHATLEAVIKSHLRSLAGKSRVIAELEALLDDVTS